MTMMNSESRSPGIPDERGRGMEKNLEDGVVSPLLAGGQDLAFTLGVPRISCSTG